MDALERTAQYLLEFETMSAEDFQLVFQPPEVLERRKARSRVQRTRQAEEKAAEQAPSQAAREAEMARPPARRRTKLPSPRRTRRLRRRRIPIPFNGLIAPHFLREQSWENAGAFFCRGSTVFPAPFPPLRHRLPWVPKIREENFDHV